MNFRSSILHCGWSEGRVYYYTDFWLRHFQVREHLSKCAYQKQRTMCLPAKHRNIENHLGAVLTFFWRKRHKANVIEISMLKQVTSREGIGVFYITQDSDIRKHWSENALILGEKEWISAGGSTQMGWDRFGRAFQSIPIYKAKS